MVSAPAYSTGEIRLEAEALLHTIARTNLQLYNQLAVQGRSDTELALIRRAYDLASQLYSGAYQADGKPFVTHVVSVASTLALLGMSSAMVAAALLHNVYNNADFGDGLQRRVTERRRRRIVDAVGADVETFISRFAELRVDRKLDALLSQAPHMSETDKALVTMDLADLLEKHLDCGVLYFGQREWVQGFAMRRADDLHALADALGQPVLGHALRVAIDAVGSGRVAPVLRSHPERKYLRFVPPLSYRRKFGVALRLWLVPRLYAVLNGLRRWRVGAVD